MRRVLYVIQGHYPAYSRGNIAMKDEQQRILLMNNDYSAIDDYVREWEAKNILWVHGKSAENLMVGKYFKKLPLRLKLKVHPFVDFHPNPSYESIVAGIKTFHEHDCDMIVAVGGGSAMDVAKCILLYENMDSTKNYLRQAIHPNDIPFLAIPTTAGTGSEATRYAVIYYKGRKQSITHERCIPNAVCFDSSTLATLSAYQKKAGMLDAISHAIESWWSVNSTEESRNYSQSALKKIITYYSAYLQDDMAAANQLMQAANLAGRAINITQTTAGHAMSYGLTHIYGIAHGHATALCNSVLWPYMEEHMDACCDSRGSEWLAGILKNIGITLNKKTTKPSRFFFDFLKDLGMEFPIGTCEEIEELATTVNSERLKNHPVHLQKETVKGLYQKLLQEYI